MQTLYELDWYGKKISIETGKMAKQTAGSAVVRMGDTMVLATACFGKAREGIDFFPLTIEYRENTYAAGKFPGGFIKREGRPTTKEILSCRLIDRSLRPLFPDNYRDEVQIIGSVLSADKEVDPDILGMVGASVALTISPIPSEDITGSVRVGRIDGKLVINPLYEERKKSDLEVVVSGTEEAVTMVEAGAQEVPEEGMLEAIFFGHTAIKELIAFIKTIKNDHGQEKVTVKAPEDISELIQKVESQFGEEIKQRNVTKGKLNRQNALSEIKNIIKEELVEDPGSDEGKVLAKQVSHAYEHILRGDTRKRIVEGTRIDGRGLDEIRTLTSEVGIIPRTHGSALFTRGETQALVTTTLGSEKDTQKVEGLDEAVEKRFYLHYNFPPFCVGEARMLRGPGRREIGHGALAERALSVVIPNTDEFGYVVRIVSDTLESNGSSSMATVCGGTLSLMDAGVAITNPVAGIAMGLVKEGDKVCVLSDIQGEEDHEGDMDFKVTGTQNGVTALQMDIKISGIEKSIMQTALEQARKGRIEILRHMLTTIPEPRSAVSEFAPRIMTIMINPDKIGAVIGPGGKMIRSITDETGAEISIDDDGRVVISGENTTIADAARKRVEALVQEPEVGKIYTGKIKSIKDFGIFVEIIPGVEGMVHISELANHYVDKVENEVSMGQEVSVKLLNIDEQGRLRLSRKAVEAENSPSTENEKEPTQET